VLHYPLFVPKSLSDWLGKDFFYMVHGHHHVHPDRPPYFPLPHSQVMAFVSYGMFRLLLPAPWACGIGAGGMGGLLRGISFFFLSLSLNILKHFSLLSKQRTRPFFFFFLLKKNFISISLSLTPFFFFCMVFNFNWFSDVNFLELQDFV
jgi:hypothetical protein